MDGSRANGSIAQLAVATALYNYYKYIIYIYYIYMMFCNRNLHFSMLQVWADGTKGFISWCGLDYKVYEMEPRIKAHAWVSGWISISLIFGTGLKSMIWAWAVHLYIYMNNTPRSHSHLTCFKYWHTAPKIHPRNMTTGKFINIRCWTAFWDRASGDFCHPWTGGIFAFRGY